MYINLRWEENKKKLIFYESLFEYSKIYSKIILITNNLIINIM
jgi:hypothetical protein